jgi:cation transport ATPase
LAADLVQAATERGLTRAATKRVAAVTGTGMTARVDGQEVLVGNGALLSDQPIDAGTVVARGELAAGGKTPMYVRIADWRPKDSRLAVVDGAGMGL